jgi:hypothetical protein
MDLSSAKALIMTILVIVPGFLYGRTKARFVVCEPPGSWQQALLWYFVHSLMVTGIAFALFIISGADITALLTKQNTAQVAQALITWQWIVVVFVLPPILGFASAMAVRLNLVDRLFDLLPEKLRGARNLAALPELSAWDACFLKLNRHRDDLLIVQVVLKTGELLFGVYGLGACANRNGNYTDLFLSQALSPQDDGSLKPVANSCGLFIRGAEIRSILLFNANGEDGANVIVPAQPKGKDESHDQSQAGPLLR